MPSVFSSLRDQIPRLAGFEDTAIDFYENGRRSYRDTNRVMTDTFITPMEKPYMSPGTAHRDPRIEGTATTHLDENLHSEDLPHKIQTTIACKAGYTPEFRPTLATVDDYCTASVKAQIILNQSKEEHVPCQIGNYPILGASLAVDSRQLYSWEHTYPFEQYEACFLKPSDDPLPTFMSEATIGGNRSDMEDFIAHVTKKKQKADRDYGASAVSFKVLYTAIKVSDWQALAELRQSRPNNTSPLYTQRIERVDYNKPGPFVQLPVRILIGSGSEWLASLKVGITPIVTDGHAEFKIEFGRSCGYEVQFLTSIGTLVGFTAMSDMHALTEFFQTFYPEANFKPPRVLELSTLAIAAGYKLHAYDPTSLCNQITGALFEDAPATFPSDYYTLTLRDLPSERIDYARWYMYQVSAVYAILQGTLIRNLFPDSEIATELLALTPKHLYIWFSELISQAISDSKIDHEAMVSAQTRKQLTLSIRKAKPKPNASIGITDDVLYSFNHVALASQPTHDVTLLADLIPSWPTIVHGGARYLHSARSFFHRQYEILKRMSTVDSLILPNLNHEVDNDLRFVTLYQRGLVFDDSPEPAPGIGLKPLPELRDSILQLDDYAPDLPVDNPQPATSDAGPQQSWSNRIVEWGRLNPHRIPLLFEVLRNSPLQADSNWMRHPSAYERLKLIMHRLLNITEVVHVIESLLMKREENVLQQEISTLSRKIQKQKLRLARFRQLSSATSNSQRSGIHQRIYKQIPGENHARNRKNRARKQAREKLLQKKYGADYTPYYARKHARVQKTTEAVISHFEDQHNPDRHLATEDLRNSITSRDLQTSKELPSHSDHHAAIAQHVETVTSSSAKPTHEMTEAEWAHWRSVNRMPNTASPHHPNHSKCVKPQRTFKRTVSLGLSASARKVASTNHPTLLKKLKLQNRKR